MLTTNGLTNLLYDVVSWPGGRRLIKNAYYVNSCLNPFSNETKYMIYSQLEIFLRSDCESRAFFLVSFTLISILIRFTFFLCDGFFK